jgi:hypothetical protein
LLNKGNGSWNCRRKGEEKQPCKFVCLMSDISNLACLPCLSYWALKSWSGVSPGYRLIGHALKLARELRIDHRSITPLHVRR